MNKREHKGFTIVELLISISIISLLGIIAIPAYRNYQQNISLRQEADAVASLLRDAQGRSIKHEGDAIWSVEFTYSSYSLLKDDELYQRYDLNGLSFGDINAFSDGSSGYTNKVSFDRSDGETANHGAIVIYAPDHPAKQIAISVNNLGRISQTIIQN